MGIKRKIKHAIKKKKERKVAFIINGHKVIKMEDYVCNGESYGPTKFVKCSKENKIKTTIYATSEVQTFDEIRIRVTIYAYPIISKKKWTYYIHESGGGETYDVNGIENNEYYDTPEKAIDGGIWYAAILEH